MRIGKWSPTLTCLLVQFQQTSFCEFNNSVLNSLNLFGNQHIVGIREKLSPNIANSFHPINSIE